MTDRELLEKIVVVLSRTVDDGSASSGLIAEIREEIADHLWGKYKWD